MKVLQKPILQRDPFIRVTWLIVFAWLAGTATAFWHFELGNWRLFGDSRAPRTVNTALVEAWFRSDVKLPSPPSRKSGLTFVHLYNPTCRCNRFTEAHLRRLTETFRDQGVRFVAAPSSAGHGSVPLGLEAIRSGTNSLHAAGIVSSPGALIFDAGGRLIYYGPYSNSAWCGSGGALVDPVLKRALSGYAQLTGVAAAPGCYCEW